MTSTPISLDDLSPKQLSELKQQVGDQQKQNSDSIVASILSTLGSNAEVTMSKSSNNPQIRHQLNVSSNGFRIFGSVYIHNKKNPDKLKELVL
jgi:hypothetical protein